MKFKTKVMNDSCNHSNQFYFCTTLEEDVSTVSCTLASGCVKFGVVGMRD